MRFEPVTFTISVRRRYRYATRTPHVNKCKIVSGQTLADLLTDFFFAPLLPAEDDVVVSKGQLLSGGRRDRPSQHVSRASVEAWGDKGSGPSRPPPTSTQAAQPADDKSMHAGKVSIGPQHL